MQESEISIHEQVHKSDGHKFRNASTLARHEKTPLLILLFTSLIGKNINYTKRVKNFLLAQGGKVATLLQRFQIFERISRIQLIVE